MVHGFFVKLMTTHVNASVRSAPKKMCTRLSFIPAIFAFAVDNFISKWILKQWDYKAIISTFQKGLFGFIFGINERIL